MKLHLVPLIIVLVYLCGLLALGWFISKYKIKDSTDYMLGGRRVGLIMLAASLSANNVGGGSTTGVATKAFGSWGMSAAWYVLAASLAMIPLAYFAPRIRKAMAFTIPEIVQRRFGPSAGGISAVLNIISLFLLTGSQILASGTVVYVLTGMPLQLAILISGAVTLVYTVLGGLLADVYSDLIQWFIIFLGLLIALPFIIHGAGGWAAIAAKMPQDDHMSLSRIGWFTIISLIINYFCTFLSGPEMMSRFSSASDEKTARNSTWLAGVMMALMAFLPTLIGLVAYAVNPNLDGGKGTSALLFATTQYAPTFIVGIVSAAIIAATMSSADSNLLCASTIFVKDIYQRYFNKGMSERETIFMTRASNVAVGIGGTFIALFNVPIVTLNLFAFALRSAGPFAAYSLGMAMPAASKHSGLVSILVGSIAAVIWQVNKEPFGILAIVFGAAASIVAFLATTFVERTLMKQPPAPPVNLPSDSPADPIPA